MNKEGGEQTIMGAHHTETLLEGSTMVLGGHASIQEIGDDGIDIAEGQLSTRRLLHDANAPIHIG